MKHTLAHVTHEAVDHIGGIGTVLEGLMVSPVYQQYVKRSILIGPTSTHMAVDPEARLGEHGKVLYSSIDKIDRGDFAGRFRPVEWAFNVRIVYGTRQYTPPGQDRTGESEVLLIDIFRTNPDRLAVFKLRLWETFGIDSQRYDAQWDYEEYARLAEPAYYALLALMRPEDEPCVLFAHEFMGMPAALQAIVEGAKHFRTVFHAHECATARRLVEDHHGHDTMFYNVLDQARQQGKYVTDVFGNLDHRLRHALVSRSHLCDGIIAVGDRTRDELKFLDPHFDDKPIDLVYNGLPAFKVDMAAKQASRAMLAAYAKALLGEEPTHLMTHVTRPVISKGLWRDMKICHELDGMLKARGESAVLFILTSGGGVRRAQDIAAMEKNYGWPRHHREGYPDLVGPEIDLEHDAKAFNAQHDAVQIVVVNQFGWTPKRIGARLPQGMTMADLRRAADVEFGAAVYEPFGISPLEPLPAGAICIISNVCGCYGFVKHATNNQGTPNVIVADYTRLDRPHTIDELLNMTQQERDTLEQSVSRDVATTLDQRLPRSDADRVRLLKEGQSLMGKMGWDQVIESGLLPMLDRISHMPLLNGDSHA